MNTKRKRRLVLLLVMVLGVGATVSLVLFALNKNINVYYTPSQITLNMPRDHLRLGGMVKKGSLKQDVSSLKMTFTITDFHKDVLITYTGVVPALFREGQGVVVEGGFHGDSFIATQVLAKHDEKYMPPGIKQRVGK